ncbi:hypothetical protein GCM10007416_19930 [Kroppenstedtia guangzhouensis]|uniref:Spore germination protein gerPA/gerPF n=1 Tax=Kroppenstedtia guangzhouensis TaxID=1274356 RepID=A0ABQ1GMH0_9BACL|nr:hypothetical protein [Kroppenstedtia guangzhouensis]GGA46777.1 hypothetical protein GCM10007416_19930 [Kroppenstedtia guangzhouensis]
MPAHISVGVIKNNNLSQGATITLGVNVVQNRNSTKQNIGNFVIGDGHQSLPTGQVNNLDSDFQDSQSIDSNNYAGIQV